jgi:hypothetical protein
VSQTEKAMKRLIWLGLLLLVLTGSCAPGGYRQGPEPYYPTISDVPPSFYGYDPALRDWYTAPYWNPSIGP